MVRRNIAGVALACGAVFVAGCLTGRATAPARPRAALERTVAAYDASTSTSDPDAAVREFRADVVVLSPQSATPAVGHEANRAAWVRFFALPKAQHAIRTEEIVMSACGDMAYTRGTWSASFARPDGTPVSGDGTLVTIWRRDRAAAARDDSVWLVAVVMAHRVH